jgi:hypothetical protein
MKMTAPIPEKIYIKPLCEYLGISKMEQDAKLDVLKSHSQDGGLLFTFHDRVKAMQAGKPIGNVYDDSDGVIECKPASEDDIEYIETAKNFILSNHFTQNGKQFTYISRFKKSGVSYDIISANNYEIDVYDIDLASVYVKKSDFINFMDESGDNVLLDLPVNLQRARTNEAGVLTPRQEDLKYSPLEQRYNFLFDWTQKALPGVPFDEFIYEYNIELTKENFYELLCNEYKKNHPNDSNIFANGADEFYKDKRITLNFKRGRRKNS